MFFRSRYFLVSIVGLLLLLSAAFFLWIRFTPSQRTAPPSATTNTEIAVTVATKPVSQGIPVRLTIPAIKVDAAVEQVGLTAEGAVDVPSSPRTVGWYNLGPRPGAEGSAVIDGHFGWKDGLPSVFDNLHELKTGDTLSSVDDQGLTTTFVVRKLQTYNQQDIVPEVFTSTDGQAHLNLITCQGVWNRLKQTYAQRLVVFADKMAE